MKTLFISASALLCAAVWAQSPGEIYRSVFADTPTGIATRPMDWPRANAEVAQFPRGHADVLRWEQAHAPTVEAPAAVPLLVLGIEDAVSRARQNRPRQSATDTRKAWILAVAAQHSGRTLRDAKEATEAGAELARRMAQVGNWSRLEQTREQVLLADATAQLARAQNAAFGAREQLLRRMGTDGPPTTFALPERLPDLPRAANLQTLPALAGSEAREAYFAYRTAFDLAVHYRDEIVPLRKFIVEEQVLRYNGMLASVWDLLAETRQQSLAVNSAIEAQRDFWLADADLQNTLQGH
nr:hypothetical protein [uncultured Albidiferax sp.]